MTSSFSTVGLIGRRGTATIRDSLEAVLKLLLAKGVRVVMEEDTATIMGNGERSDRDLYERAPRLALGERADLIVVVGGDGIEDRGLREDPSLAVVLRLRDLLVLVRRSGRARARSTGALGRGRRGARRRRPR